MRKITLGENFTDKYKNSIKVRVADDLRLQADGVVIFNCSYGGNTVTIHISRIMLKMENIQISIF